ncbi:CAP domain-containing protein [Lactobacillus melliventris]|uniref:CAP domain-containing protein n=1 Tax=Lactobacillus melliventris TaxID=1218507 RepID=UPI0016501BAD|nr:SLAP domain-containing protein [Lactobacillus melliventris]MBC6349047.1 CAP domain-containing protein [Lactobacillus melliventris]
MKKISYHKLVAAVVAITSIASGLFVDSRITEAKSVSGSIVLKAPAVKRVKVKRKANLYNNKGRKLKKKFLKKGRKLTVIKKTKKIRGKKFYFVTKNKLILAKDVTTLKTKAKKPQNLPTNSSNTQDKVTPPNSTNTGTTQTAKKNAKIESFSLSEFRQEFLKKLNEERAQRGLNAVSEDANLDEVVQNRTKLLPDNFAHVDAAGNFILNDFFNKAGVKRHSTAECLAMFPWGVDVNHSDNSLLDATKNASSALVADNMIYEYIYNDAESNWGHRDILLDPSAKTIGLGAIAENESEQIYSSVGVIY